MAKSPSTAALILIALGLGGALAGCSGNSDFPILDREQTADDVLPDSVTGVLELDDYDLDSSRLSASADGVDYFVIERVAGSGRAEPCLVVAADDPIIGCGGRGFVEVSGLGIDDAQLVPGVARDGDGWTAISDNVRTRPKPR